MQIRWIHISDIHYHFNNYDSEMLREDLLKRISTHREMEPITHIFCSGDLTDKNGHISNDLYKYMESIASSAMVPKKNFIIVPGNHDHDRSVIQEILTNTYSCKDKSSIDENIRMLKPDQVRILLESFKSFNSFYSSFIGIPYYDNCENPHASISDSLNNCNILKINTAWLDCNSESGDIYCGINKLHDVLKNECYGDDSVNIAIGHHPLNYLCEEESMRIKDLFHRNNIGIYLCGHTHIPNINFYYEHDIVEIICTSGKSDKYSSGGYAIGTINTDLKCYKIELFKWCNGSWFRENNISLLNENSTYYLNTKRYKHDTNKIVVAFKLLGTQLSINDINDALGDDRYELLQYPYSNICTNDVNWVIQKNHVIELADKILNSFNKTIYIFPIAPIPLLIQLGYELQNNSNITIFQYDRVLHRWVYNKEDEICEFITNSIIKGQKKLAIKISTSLSINEDQIIDHIGVNFDVYEIMTIPKELGYPLYHNQYMLVLNKLFDDIDNIASSYAEIHIFAAIPAGMAIELGRRFQKGIYPPIVLYNYYQGYSQCLIINEKEKPNIGLMRRILKLPRK